MEHPVPDYGPCDAVTRVRVCRLEATPQYQQWAKNCRRRQQAGVVAGFLAVVLLFRGIWVGIQRLPPNLRLPVIDTSLVSELPLGVLHAARQRYLAANVSKASQDGELAPQALRDDEAAQLRQDLLAAQQRAEEGLAREDQLRVDLQAAQAAEQRAREAHSIAAQAREDALRRQLANAQEQLLAAAAQAADEPQQPGLPAGTVAAAALALAAAFGLYFWHASARAGRRHRSELAALQVTARCCFVVPASALLSFLARPPL